MRRRVGLLAAVVAVAIGTLSPSPASAATQSFNGTVVAPIATPGPGLSTNFQGVMVDGSLGLYHFQLLNSISCCPRFILTTLDDGSSLHLQTQSESYSEVVPNLVYSVHRAVVVTAGTGRFAGASGGGTYDSTLTTTSVPLLITPLGAVTVGSLSLQLTTP